MMILINSLLIYGSKRGLPLLRCVAGAHPAIDRFFADMLVPAGAGDTEEHWRELLAADPGIHASRSACESNGPSVASLHLDLRGAAQLDHQRSAFITGRQPILPNCAAPDRSRQWRMVLAVSVVFNGLLFRRTPVIRASNGSALRTKPKGQKPPPHVRVETEGHVVSEPCGSSNADNYTAQRKTAIRPDLCSFEREPLDLQAVDVPEQKTTENYRQRMGGQRCISAYAAPNTMGMIAPDSKLFRSCRFQ